MSPRDWNGEGPEFVIEWGGRRWSLKVDLTNPGLRGAEGGFGATLLSLTGLAEAGRSQAGLFTAETLVGYELHRNRVMVTFAPPGWGGVNVRAAWGGHAATGAIDLEIQVTASSVGQLQNLEVYVDSRFGTWPEDNAPVCSQQVEPRDLRSAALSYDGREAEWVVQSLTTLPVPGLKRPPLAPRVVAAPMAETAGSYLELVRPDDVARRITCLASSRPENHERILGTRYALFGHDLEKGVVLRARLRGLWTDGQPTDTVALSLQHSFISEALPLGP